VPEELNGGVDSTDLSWNGPVVAIGASAGGVEALRQLVSRLPAELDVPILVAIHSAAGPSVLPELLERAGSLPSAHAEEQQVLVPGRIFVAPPDRHLVVDGTVARVTSGPRENGHRPSVDTLFRSVAHSFGSATVAVVLSGMLDDGAYGARVVRRCDGTVLVQRPDTALFPSMPQAAIDAGGASAIVTVDEIAERIVSCGERWRRGVRLRDAGGSEDAPGSPAPEEQEGVVSSYVCPNCGGALWEHDSGGLLHFRCRTGHTYSPGSLMDVNAVALDDALWGAYRALLERSDLARHLSERFATRGIERSGDRWREIGDEASRRAEILRRALQPPTRLANEPEASQSAS
jgi:two-component system, chemotaxis family, protein-glutamate methylesterase/glutaminase